MTAHPHLAIQAFALHLLLERSQRLVDIVVANLNFHGALHSIRHNSEQTKIDPPTHVERPAEPSITDPSA